MKYVLTEKQVENILEEIREISIYGSWMSDFRPLAENKNENIGVIRINETVYVCEDDAFTKCIATGDMEWWESVKQEYLSKGFTEDFWEDDEED